MSIESKMARHWTDEQMWAQLYGAGPEDGHLAVCEECRQRIRAMQMHRTVIEEQSAEDFPSEDVSPEFLAAQRRRIYTRLERPTHWWHLFDTRRWLPAAGIVCGLAAGVIAIEQFHPFGIGNGGRDTIALHVSDAQLAAEVSRFASDSEPDPTAPLQALFEE